ncbi:968_t:CDS:2, partial [Funneliformis mosseae]
VKNHVRLESRDVQNYAVANGLQTSMTLCKTCAHLEDFSVGIYIQIGEAYANNPKFETYHYGEGRNRHGNMTLNFSNTNDTKKVNKLIDMSMICRLTEFKFICRMFPVVYGSHATKRTKEINNDNNED